MGDSITSVAVGDMNADGRLDLAAVNVGDDNVSVLLGNGSGGFAVAAGSPVATGDGPQSVAIGDLNADGRPDLVVANGNTDNVSVLLGNGSGGLTAATPVTVGTEPENLALGQLNADGHLDLAVTNIASHNVSVLLGNGSGGFAAATGSPIAVGMRPAKLAIGDVNADGRADLAVPNTQFDTTSILLGNGNGGFTAAQGSPVPTGDFSSSVALGHFDADGRTDLAVTTNGTPDAVAVFLGNGSGRFAPAAGSPVAAGSDPNSVETADFNLDGHLDLVTTNFTSDDATVLLGNGSGGFTPAPESPLASGNGSRRAAIGDFNGDGRPDLAVGTVAARDVSVFLNTSAPAATANTAGLTFPNQPQSTISDAQTLTLSNTGDAPLRITRAEIVGASPEDFVAANDTCTRETLAAGAACSVRVRFAPTAAGARAATLRITSNAAQQDVALSGEGAAPPTTGPGPSGPAGPPGQTGSTGPQGTPGRDAKVTCKVAKRRGRKVKVTCRVVLSAPSRAKVSARLMRGGRLYARAAGSGSLRLRPVRRLTRGRYTLRLLVTDPDGRAHRSRHTVIVD
jgi:hypothetical protein